MNLEQVEIERLNDKYELKQTVVRFHTYLDTYSRQIASVIQNIFKTVDGWHDPKLEDISLLLRTFSAHARSLLLPAESAKDYFLGLAENIESQGSALSGSVPLAFNQLVNEFVILGPQLAMESLAIRVSVLESLLSSKYKSALLIGETKSLRLKIGEWAASVAEKEISDLSFVEKLADIEGLHDSPFDMCVVLGAPSRLFRSQSFKTSHLRNMIGGGLTREAIFLYPTWIRDIDDLDFELELFNGLPPSARLQIIRDSTDNIHQSGIEHPGPEPQLDDFDDFSFDEFTFVEPEIVALANKGSVECILIECSGGFIFPIEKKAMSLGGIQISDLDNFVVEIRDIAVKDLNPSDVILARIDSSERESLRDNTLRRLGSQGQSFVDKQARWKKELNDLSMMRGWKKIESDLANLGMKVSPRPEAWADELSIGPASFVDFKLLLEYLDWEDAEANEAIHLSRDVWNELIHEGHSVRAEVVRQISDDVIFDLQAHRTVFITVEEHGDARYALSPVSSKHFETHWCDSSQVRRLTRRP